MRALVDAVLPAHNAVIYNRNPELHATRVLFPRLEVRGQGERRVPVDLSEALRGVVWRYDNSWRPDLPLAAVDRCIFAGTPEWFGPMTGPLVEALGASPIPVAYLGIGTFEGRDDLRFEDLPAADRTLLERAALITTRDPACARLLAPAGARHLPCPALFSAPREQVRTPAGRLRIALCTQAFAQGNTQRLREPAAGFVRALFPRLAREFDCTLVCHYADEALELADWLTDVPLRYSYDPRDYIDIYDGFDLTVTTRVHGAGLCASLGIPALVVAHSARSVTVDGFLSAQIDADRHTVDDVVSQIRSLDIARRSREIVAHKAATRSRYDALLRPFLLGGAGQAAGVDGARATRPGRPAASGADFETALRAHRRGDLDTAQRGYRALLADDPDRADALHCLALVLHTQGRSGEAIDHLQRSTELRPDNATYWSNLGFALLGAGQAAQAVGACRRALALDPDLHEARSHLADALLADGEFAAAVRVFDEVLERQPQDNKARNGRAMALQRSRDLCAAIAAYRDVIERAPDSAEAHANLGFALLAAGRYREGWPEYAWRRRMASYRHSGPAPAVPRWRGEPVNGRTVLVHSEQGLGDTLMFARFVPRLEALGARVQLAVQPALVRLLDSLAGDGEVFAGDAPRDGVDLRCALPDLPACLDVTLDDLPGPVPYLHALPADVERLRERIPPSRDLTVGLVWAGSTEFAGDALRSPGLANYAALFAIPGLRFVALQRDPGHEQLAGSPFAGQVLDLYADLTDMALTAAAMQHVDVVVSSCTAPLHLAGALGRPALAAIPCTADWRWLEQREDSPWYPSLRLFRQSRPHRWHDVVERIGKALEQRRDARPA